MQWDGLSGISGLGQPGTGDLALQAQLLASDLSARPSRSRSGG